MAIKSTLYVVYFVIYNEEVIYIGYGSQNRHLHAVSGVSHVYELNKLHHTGCEVNTKIVFTTTVQQEAKDYEKDQIILYKPIYNKVYLVNGRQDAAQASLKVKKKIELFLEDHKLTGNVYNPLKSLFEGMQDLFSIARLIDGIPLNLLPNVKPMKQFKRFVWGDSPSRWYTILIESGMLEITNTKSGHFIKLKV